MYVYIHNVIFHLGLIKISATPNSETDRKKSGIKVHGIPLTIIESGIFWSRFDDDTSCSDPLIELVIYMIFGGRRLDKGIHFITRIDEMDHHGKAPPCEQMLEMERVGFQLNQVPSPPMLRRARVWKRWCPLMAIFGQSIIGFPIHCLLSLDGCLVGTFHARNGKI